MKRPAFQFYPADWRNNAKLRRCSDAARGVWMDVLSLLHDSDEYGVCRWPLEDLARAAGAAMRFIRELVQKDVLKGADRGFKGYIHIKSHAGRDEPITLIQPTEGPVWFSSRMVRDEWQRQTRGGATRVREGSNNNPVASPNQSPMPPFGEALGEWLGDGSSTSSSSAEESSLRSDSASPPNGEASKPKRSSPRSKIKDFTPSAAERRWAEEHWRQAGRADLAANLDAEIGKFLDHHRGRGTVAADWPACWRTWARNALQFSRPAPKNISEKPFKTLTIMEGANVDR